MTDFTPSADVLSGETADIYFARTIEILGKEGINPVAVMEVFPRSAGILCGMKEVQSLLSRVLQDTKGEVWSLREGDCMDKKEVVLRISAPYRSYGLYETAICGILAHCSGWATAARECSQAAGDLPVVSFGARHVHPSVTGVMDYSAVVGGCKSCSSSIGSRLTGLEPSGTIPHALILVMGDTASATLAFDKHMPSGIPRVALVDTFINEAEESINVAEALGDNLDSVRLDTPAELGGVTVDMVKKVRQRLDNTGFQKVKIFASGGFNPVKIRQFIEEAAPVDGFGIGSYITSASPIDFTADLHQVDGKAIAKRGRCPGITPNPRLKSFM
ncbi:nicotinate phosphoribosyltransferase [Chloroflexota bacterium]